MNPSRLALQCLGLRIACNTDTDFTHVQVVVVGQLRSMKSTARSIEPTSSACWHLTVYSWSTVSVSFS